MARIKPVVYFEDTGKWRQNTKGVVETVGEYLKGHRVRHVVMATNTGYVGAQFAPLAERYSKVNFVGVKMAPAIDKMYDVKWSARYGRTMEKAGVKLACGTLYLFSQGMKVCVEVIAMACDAGLVPEGVQVVSCAGTGHGSDTAIVATSACSANLFDMTIHQVLAMPLKK